MSGILQRNRIVAFTISKIWQGQKQQTSIILRFYFKSDFNGFFSFDSLWNFLPAFVNKVDLTIIVSEIKVVKGDQEAPTPKMITF